MFGLRALKGENTMGQEPVLRLRGLTDGTIEVRLYEDHVTCVTEQSCILVRRDVESSVRYKDLTRIMVRRGPWCSTLRLEDKNGHIILVSAAKPDDVDHAGMLISDRVYRMTRPGGSTASGDITGEIHALVDLYDRGMLTDDYFQGKQ